MPAPQAIVMKQAARQKFASFGLRVPPNWQQPQGDRAQMMQQSLGLQSQTDPGSPIAGQPLFLPASSARPHIDIQKMHHAKYGEFVDQVCEGICAAWQQWQSLATLTGVVVNAATASLGQVAGPPWAPTILQSGRSPQQTKYLTAIATTLSNAWIAYTASIKIPALPWYPAFAVFAGPLAPPTPNVPSPLTSLTQVTAPLQPMLLKQQMVGALGDPSAPFAAELFEAICYAFDQSFQVWQPATMVTNVVGSGPIPTFAPPYVPVGPVVGGVAQMPPGGFV